MRKYLILALSLIFVVGMNSCKLKKDIQGKTWYFKEVVTKNGQKNGADKPYTVILKGKNQVEVKFDANSCVGSFEWLGENKIKLSPLGCTEMCCDSKYANIFKHNWIGEMEVNLEGEDLVLSQKGKTIRLTKTFQKDEATANVKYSMKHIQGGCFGTCPIFEVEYFHDGKAIFKGKKFVKEEGTKEFKLTKEELAMVFGTANVKNYFKEKTVFDNKNISDLPMTKFINGAETLTIRTTTNTPQEVLNYQTAMMDIVRSRGYLDYNPEENK